MTTVHRVLFPHPIESLDEYVKAGGGDGLEAAKQVEPDTLIAEIEASGLRGRGGAGFPTGTKWRTVAENRSLEAPATVVVNGAEGEPGTFKDRTILRINPYQVVEGALIAARAVGADGVILALKEAFGPEVHRVREAVKEIEDAGWADGVELIVFEGPSEYLYGEETALLEAIAGRDPLPRIAPPFRRGVKEVVETAADAASESGLSAHVEMAGPDSDTAAAPTLVDNVETLANVPRIIARGAAWFRTEGTEKSPGTIVCTVTGSTRHHGVGEVIMGTPLREVIEELGGGPRPGARIKAVMIGVSNALLPGALLDTPVTYEDLAAAGSGLGTGGFMVFDDDDDLVAVTAGVSRFLAVESCGQCTPCKQDGLALSGLLAGLSRSDQSENPLASIESLVSTVANESRCYLATQHQTVVASLLERFPDEVQAHAGITPRAAAVEPALVAELLDIENGGAVVDVGHAEKQPDWSFDETDSGKAPADHLGDHRADSGTST
ncbi:MAG TPA: NADH-ubiquinone oxidoreductase-F iron-sulfur binding region domain-containing protein [Acidimicrobiales bacterium]|nr:NADH-ubiquinone oxidoreductase-F iron-sulfur binding region domain-containing protein [Acidimicrobiales bacterium]